MIALTATMKTEVPNPFLISCGAAQLNWFAHMNQPNIGTVKAYHKLWELHRDHDILIYMHDDVTIHAGEWLERVCLELMTPEVAIVGLGGARGIGVPDLYKVPYRIQDLIRIGYSSNQTDAETHGERDAGERRVAVVDGFFMAIRGSFLAEVGGWDWIQSNFHCYDTAMCLEAIRRGWQVAMVGAECTHHGGGTSTTPAYAEWCKERGTTMELEHELPHRWLYERYRDILPYMVTE